jgi:hypothetical protein
MPAGRSPGFSARCPLACWSRALSHPVSGTSWSAGGPTRAGCERDPLEPWPARPWPRADAAGVHRILARDRHRHGRGALRPAFSALGRLHGEDARPAITQVTLFRGFTSTACWSLTAILAETIGGRGTCLAYAAIHLAVVLPLYWFGLPRKAPQRAGPKDRWRPSPGGAARGPAHGFSPPRHLRGVAAGPANGPKRHPGARRLREAGATA